jgi:hypothetical protein
MPPFGHESARSDTLLQFGATVGVCQVRISFSIGRRVLSAACLYRPLQQFWAIACVAPLKNRRVVECSAARTLSRCTQGEGFHG